MRKRTQARECALQILYQADITGYPLDEILPFFWDAHPVPDDVRLFAEELARGTLQGLADIDRKIAHYAENWDLKRMAVVDRNILRFSVYELLDRPDIPPKVTINEAVTLAKKYSQAESGKFVNGILDKIFHTDEALQLKQSSQNIQEHEEYEI